MKRLKQMLANFDMFYAPATLRTGGQPQTSSSFTGLISFLIGCFFTYIFLLKVQQILSFTQISTTQSLQMLSSKQPHAQDLMFAISMEMPVEDIVSYFHVYALPMVDGRYEEAVELYPCQEHQWKLLGEDYREEFGESSLEHFLCPDSVNSLKLKYAEFTEGFQSIIVIIEPCSLQNCLASLLPPKFCICKDRTQIEQFIDKQLANKGFVGVWVYLLDQAVHNEAQNPIHYFVNTDAFLSFTKTRGELAILEFSSYEVITDIGIWPYPQTQTLYGYSLDSTKYVTKDIITFGHEYARLQISMCRKKYKYERKVGKIDEMLSYVGGLFSLVITFLAFFMNSYNQYRYEIGVAQSCFNYDEKGDKVTRRDFNFWTYIKYSFYSWSQTLLLFPIKSQHCQEIDLTRQQVLKQMDVSNLYKKLQEIQTCLAYLLNQDDKLCLSLVEPPQLATVKSRRLIGEYYEAVVMGEEEITLEDMEFGRKKGKIEAKSRKKKKNGIQKEQKQNKIESICLNMPLLKKFIEQTQKENPQKVRKLNKQVELNQQLKQVQQKLRKAFKNLSKQSRAKICGKIPLQILCRLADNNKK